MLCVLIRSASSILMSTLNIQLLCRRSIDFPELVIFASRPGVMINLHWLELPMARTLFHGPKDVRATEVRLYLAFKIFTGMSLFTIYNIFQLQWY